jgi:3-hydroxybutyryl-CoA dehydratase
MDASNGSRPFQSTGESRLSSPTEWGSRQFVQSTMLGLPASLPPHFRVFKKIIFLAFPSLLAHAQRPMKFSELAIGQTASKTVLITPEMIACFADVSGDHNPLHTDPEYAESRFGGVIAHGVLLVSFFSALLATDLPGPGSVARSLGVRFKAPARPGDQVRIEVKIVELIPRIRKAVLEGRAYLGDQVLLQITAETLSEE